MKILRSLIALSAALWWLAFRASFSDFWENKVLDRSLSKTDLPAFVSGQCYMALCTVVPTDASTGATITEATYTGYARKQIAAADWNAAAAGQSTNANAVTFAACTAGTSTIIGFAFLDSVTIGAGNVLMWGTTTSKVIDINNTPPNVAVSGLVVNLD